MFILRVVQALDRHKVEYAIVGGYAVALHGAVRGTVDLDLILKLTKESFIGAEKAFHSIGMESRLPVKAHEIFAFREEYIKNRNLVAWSFYNPAKPSELVDIIITHDLKRLKTRKFELQGQRLNVLEIGGLIKMKKESGRAQDLEDVKALEGLRK